MSESNGKTGAEAIRWDLSDLYHGVDDPQITSDIEAAKKRGDTFAEKYRGKVSALSALELNTALEEFENIWELMGRVGSYANLVWTTDTANKDYGRLLARFQQESAALDQKLVFFTLEWMSVSDDVAKVVEDPTLSNYRHYLEVTRLSAPYALSEKEEQVISELDLSGASAWGRYFGEVLGATRFEFEGKELTQSELLNYTYSPDRELRRQAAEVFTDGLEKISHTTTFVFNMIATNKRSIDKLRDYPTWITSRNLSNQTDDATVETLIESVTSRYDIVAQYYDLTRRLLGYDELYEYDRYAPILDESLTVHWDEARDIILDSFDAFHPDMANIAGLFFEKNWIDAAIAPNKRGGAYSARTVPSVHPYIFMNYTGQGRSVMTLAHELGHGVHQYLSRERGFLQQTTPLTTAEMASTFGEMLVFDALMAQVDDPKVRLSMRIDKIGNTFATVFRQISMNRFENALHTAARSEGELTTERISELWMDTQRPMFGDSVTLRDEYSLWWSYIPHFIGVPGYVYAYAFGELLVWSLYARYKAGADNFADKYINVLSQGGSVWPHDLLAPLDIDLKDANFWHDGLDQMHQMVELAEQEASALEFRVR